MNMIVIKIKMGGMDHAISCKCSDFDVVIDPTALTIIEQLCVGLIP